MCNSPISMAARRCLRQNPHMSAKAIVHHVEVDMQKVKVSKEEESTLQNMAIVAKRTQRALTPEEIAEKELRGYRAWPP